MGYKRVDNFKYSHLKQMQRANHPTNLNNPKASPNKSYSDDYLSTQKRLS